MAVYGLRFALYAFLQPHDECLQKNENVKMVSIFMPIGKKKKKYPQANAQAGESAGANAAASAEASTNG